MDGVIAIGFAFFIIYTGYTIVRSSIAGIMDEADHALLEKLVGKMNDNRREKNYKQTTLAKCSKFFCPSLDGPWSLPSLYFGF